MKAIRKFVLCLTFIFVSLFSFAEDWCIYLGSFKNKTNAEKRVKLLRSNSINTSITEYKSPDGTVYYRVVWDDHFESFESAKLHRNMIASLPVIQKEKINDIWYERLDTKTAASTSKSAQTPSATTVKETPKTETKPAAKESTTKAESKPAAKESTTKAESKPAAKESTTKAETKPAAKESTTKTETKPAAKESTKKTEATPTLKETTDKSSTAPVKTETPKKTEGKSAVKTKTSPDLVALEKGSYKIKSDLDKVDIRGLHFEEGHTDWVNAIAYSPDGKYIASGGSNADANIRIWDVKSGKEVKVFSAGNMVNHIVYSPDGKSIFFDGSSIKSCHLSTDGLMMELDVLSSSLDCSADGKLLVSGYYEDIKIFDVETGNQLKSLNGHTAAINDIACSPDGKYIASAGGYSDGSLRIWDMKSYEEVMCFPGKSSYVTSVEFSPDGKYCAGGYDDGSVCIWNVETWKEETVLKESATGGTIQELSFSPDGKSLAIASLHNKVSIFNIERKKIVKAIETKEPVSSVTYSPDGMYLAYGSWDRAIHICDATSGVEQSVLGRNAGSVCDVIYSPDGKYIASGGVDRLVRIWNSSSGEQSKVLSGHTDSVESIAYRFDGKHLASLASDSWDNTARIWDPVSGKELRSIKMEKSYMIAYSPDGKNIANCGDEKSAVYDASGNGELFVFNECNDKTNYVTNIAYSPDGKMIAGSGAYNWGAKIWDASSGKELANFEKGKKIDSLTFSPDGKQLCFFCDTDNAVMIYDVKTMSAQTVINGLFNISCIAYSPDGKKIAFVSSGNQMLLYDVANKQVAWAIAEKSDSSLRSVAYSPDGKRVVAACSGGKIMVYDSSNGEKICTMLSYMDGEYIVHTPEGFFTGSEWACKNLIYTIDGLNATALSSETYKILNRPDLIRSRLLGE